MFELQTIKLQGKEVAHTWLPMERHIVLSELHASRAHFAIENYYRNELRYDILRKKTLRKATIHYE